MADETIPRETGAAKAPMKCPNCGDEVATIESPYGGLSGAACPKCYPATSAEQVSAPVEPQTAALAEPPRETGTVTGIEH